MEQNYQTYAQDQHQYAQTNYNQGQQYAQAQYNTGMTAQQVNTGQYAQTQPQTNLRQKEPQYDQNMYNSPNAQYQTQPAASSLSQSLSSWFDYKNRAYLKGLFIGVGATLIATNPTVQKAIVKGAVAVWGGLQGSVEEIKEQVEDIKAELAEK